MSFDLIGYIIKIFQEEYKLNRGTDYYADKKDRGAVGLLLAKFKKKNPEKNSEEMCESIRSYFRDVLQIQENFYKNNMSLCLLNSKINEINQQILEMRRLRKQHKFNDDVSKGLKNIEKQHGTEIKKLWQPEKDTKYQRPLMSRLQFLKEYGASRINEYELYKKNMEK